MSCILIGGEIGAGKTATAELLGRRLAARVVRVREALEDVLGLREPDRRALQEEGAALDRRTQGRWLLEYLLEQAETERTLIVDAVRTERQTIPILDRLPDTKLVYLSAHPSVRRHRYLEAAASDPLKASTPFEKAVAHPTEVEVRRLSSIADVLVETNEISVARAVETILAELRL
jgi:adenylosuccinate synthase